MSRRWFAALALLFSLPASAHDQFRLALGSAAVGYVETMKPDFEQKMDCTVVTPRPEGITADNVMIAIDTGRAELGLFGNSWDDMMAVIREKQVSIHNMSAISHRDVGLDHLYIVTYKGGPKELTRAQIKKLITGAAKNWSEVGGSNLPVQIVVQANTPATQKFISKTLLDGAEINHKGAKRFQSYGEVADFVGSTPGAISFVPGFMANAKVNVPKQPDLSRPMTAVYIGKPTARAETFMEMFQKRYLPK